ncbi:MAG: hypothetical protein LUQ54_02060, partial [Methanoregula sp.]|nr:hypothetical protein [Methanoregula sp.]
TDRPGSKPQGFLREKLPEVLFVYDKEFLPSDLNVAETSLHYQCIVGFCLSEAEQVSGYSIGGGDDDRNM